MRTGIAEGDADGVKVELDLERSQVVITTVNNFDVYWMLSRRDSAGKPYAERFNSEDFNKAVFGVPLGKLTEKHQQDELNKKILAARNFSKEVLAEHEHFEYVVSFDHSDSKNAKFKPAFPQSGFSIGKVVHAGKYFAVLEQGVKGDDKYFQVIKTNAFLSGAHEFYNREETVAKKMPLGSMKYITQDNKGKLNISEYTPRNAPHQAPQLPEVAPEPAPVQLPINQAQKNALMAFREANGRDWKGKLMHQWSMSHYPSTPQDQRGLLQQVRNEQGPEFLINLKVADLYLGTPVAAAPSSPAPSKAAPTIGGR